MIRSIMHLLFSVCHRFKWRIVDFVSFSWPFVGERNQEARARPRTPLAMTIDFVHYFWCQTRLMHEKCRNRRRSSGANGRARAEIRIEFRFIRFSFLRHFTETHTKIWLSQSLSPEYVMIFLKTVRSILSNHGNWRAFNRSSGLALLGAQIGEPTITAERSAE